ncbi:Uncharacterised protein [Salmonella enterica subsp. enterica serovar Bovismorbificans]|uniref:Uncharacterized protein n=1 Tax=Salmonella enterica subsp. enterica serovar Bovismorbificans TaxID=58097 RepID=A0A655BS55_SALET|nr:Uncharacterised protein [Salmonella enterica subsp. enterica serovar Bovismorbificans]
MRSGSAIISPIVIRGLSDASGSWKIIWISLRTSRHSSAFMPNRSFPSQATLPSVAFTRPIMARANVDLPQPDSPTTPSVSPSYRRSVTPSTAFRVFGGCQNHCFPSLISKCTFRSAISRRTLRCSITAFIAVPPPV